MLRAPTPRISQGLLVLISPHAWRVPVPTLWLAAQVSFEPVFEAKNVEMEFFMLADLVV
jgi:hypothetical protein